MAENTPIITKNNSDDEYEIEFEPDYAGRHQNQEAYWMDYEDAITKARLLGKKRKPVEQAVVEYPYLIYMPTSQLCERFIKYDCCIECDPRCDAQNPCDCCSVHSFDPTDVELEQSSEFVDYHSQEYNENEYTDLEEDPKQPQN